MSSVNPWQETCSIHLLAFGFEAGKLQEAVEDEACSHGVANQSHWPVAVSSCRQNVSQQPSCLLSSLQSHRPRCVNQLQPSRLSKQILLEFRHCRVVSRCQNLALLVQRLQASTAITAFPREAL